LAGQQVAQGVLHGEGDDGGDDGGGGDDLAEGHAGGVEAEQAPADVADRDDDVGDDARDADLAQGQQKLEQQDPPDLHQHQPGQQAGDLHQPVVGQRQTKPAPLELDQQDHHQAYHHEAELAHQLPPTAGAAQEMGEEQEQGQQGPERVFANPQQGR